jgi:hypothetical protein
MFEVNLRRSAFFVNDDMMVEIGRLYASNAEAAYNANRETSNSIALERALWQKNPLRTGTKTIQHRQCGYLHTQMTHRYSHDVEVKPLRRHPRSVGDTADRSHDPQTKAQSKVYGTRDYISTVVHRLRPGISLGK